MGATNRPELVDPSILRAGRLGLHIEVPLPHGGGTAHRTETFCAEYKVKIADSDLAWTVEQTEGNSGADLRLLANVLQMQADDNIGDARAKLKSALAGIKTSEAAPRACTI